MSNLTTGLVFVLLLNVLMFLAQATMVSIEPTNDHFNFEGSLLDNFDVGTNNSNRVLDTSDLNNLLPEGEGSVSPTTGNIFTDIFSSTRSWFADKLGLNYLYGIVSAPYNFLKITNLPNAFVFAIGTMWYALTFFLIVAFIFGRDI